MGVKRIPFTVIITHIIFGNHVHSSVYSCNYHDIALCNPHNMVFDRLNIHTNCSVVVCYIFRMFYSYVINPHSLTKRISISLHISAACFALSRESYTHAIFY
jgi:hypothetical protein